MPTNVATQTAEPAFVPVQVSAAPGSAGTALAITTKTGRIDLLNQSAVPGDIEVKVGAGGDWQLVRAGSGGAVPLTVDMSAATVYVRKANSDIPGSLALTVRTFPATPGTASSTPLGPFTDAAALQTASPAGTVGRVASVGATAPYALYDDNGSAWVARGGAASVPIATNGVSFIESEPSGSGGGGTGRTSYLKAEAEAPFSRFRIWLRSNDTVNSDGWIASGSVTEDPSVATVNAICVPVVGGTSYNNIRSATSANQYGFVSAAFSQNGGVLAATVAATGDPSGRVTSVLVSDWIPAASVSPTSGTRPFALARVAKATGSNGTTTFPDPARQAAWAAASAQPFFRHRRGLSAAGDGVGTPATLPTNTSQNAEFWIDIEFDYNLPVRSVLAPGDSITAGGGFQQYGWGSWITLAALSASTVSKPITIYNAGLSGRKTASFVQSALNVLAAGARPSILVLPALSPNDSVVGNGSDINAYLTQLNRGLMLNLIQQCRLIGCRVIVWTAFYEKSLSAGTQKTFVAAQNQWARDLGASGAVVCLDTVPGFDTATMLGDAIHPNPTGTAYLQGLLQPLLVA